LVAPAVDFLCPGGYSLFDWQMSTVLAFFGNLFMGAQKKSVTGFIFTRFLNFFGIYD